MAQDQSTYLKRLRAANTIVKTSYTRPADANVYAVGDVLAQSTSAATVLTFTNMARYAGGGGIIQNARMIASTAPATKAEIDLFLFDTAPAMQNDNVAWAPSDSEMEFCQGVFTFYSSFLRLGNGNGVYDLDAVGKSFQCAAGSTSMYGICVLRNAYTPASAEKFTFSMGVIPD